MSEKSVLALRGRNPDILTSIANLSNDEVITPPDFANRMLDTLSVAWSSSHNGANIWEDSQVTFLDPATKSGVFLREITKRLIAGLEREFPSLNERVNHILTKQVFGIGITELTALLARRSVYCSKWANGEHSICSAFTNDHGNVWFERITHTWIGGNSRIIEIDEDGQEYTKTTNGKCKYCGANQKDYERDKQLETHAYAFIHTEDLKGRIQQIFGVPMKFDVIIGNPPYQLGQSGGESVGGFAMPIYQKFVDAAKSLDPHFISFVIPSRWFAGGRGLDDFRQEMLSDNRIQTLVDFPDASEVFAGTPPKGGVSYFLWNKSWSGDCQISTVEKGVIVSGPETRSLSEFDVLIRRNEAVPILRKVLKKMREENIAPLSLQVSPIQPFGLRTNFRGASTPSGISEPIKVYENGGVSYVSRSQISKNDQLVENWKVLLGRAYGAGDGYPHQIFNYPIVAEPPSACTETYLVIKNFSTEKDAQNFEKYLRTRFVRFLVSLRKNTQDLYSERFAFVPDIELPSNIDDEKLSKMFGLTAEDEQVIESLIRPMENSDDS